MKSFSTSRRGPFQKQTFYESEEVERICIEALRQVNLYPKNPEPIRIDRFIEKRFGITIDYEDLSQGLLGYTAFGKDGVKKVTIAKIFDEESTQPAQRRLRSTIAHEAGHCLLHTHLFCLAEENTQQLFADYTEPSKPKVLCRDIKEERKSYDGSWWEYQANMAIGALLLPRHLMNTALRDMLTTTGKLGIKTLTSEKKDNAVLLISEIFNVNPAVAKIRIDEVWPEIKSNQMQI